MDNEDKAQKPLNEQTIQELLDADAIAAEHTKAAEDTLQDWAVGNLEDAKNAIEYCLKNAEKDSTRLSAAKFVFSEAKGTKESEDKLQELIDSLTSDAD